MRLKFFHPQLLTISLDPLRGVAVGADGDKALVVELRDSDAPQVRHRVDLESRENVDVDFRAATATLWILFRWRRMDADEAAGVICGDTLEFVHDASLIGDCAVSWEIELRRSITLITP